jgi:phosphatidylglycerophosphatase A
MRSLLSFSASAIALWFWSGKLPKAPGTWGSLAALPFAWLLIVYFGSPLVLFIAAAFLLPVGVWASAQHSNKLGTHDAGEIVVDEVAGQWIALAVAPYSPLGWVAAFLLFRFFDVIKPWPISWIDARVSGGWGIMADDIVAGIFAAACVWCLWTFVGDF